MGNIELKIGNIHSINEMIELTRENYGEIEIANHDFLRWQYEDNPSGKAYIKLAYHDGELASQYVVIPMKMKVDQQIQNVTLSLNTLTRAKYRGKGLFTMLAESTYLDCSEDRIFFTYGFPNPNSYPGFIKKLNFRDLGTIPLMIRPLKIKAMFQKKFRNVVFSNLGKMGQVFFKNPFGVQLEDVVEMGIESIDLFNEFWKDIQTKYRIMGVRDSNYIKWRYMDIPLRDYKIFGYVKDDTLLAYAVTRLTDIETFKSGMIVDFLCLEKCGKAGEHLIQYVLNYFYEQNMDMVGCLMLRNTEEYEVLKKNKFIKIPKFLEPQPFPVILRQHIDDQMDYSLKNWFLTMGDYDVI